MERHARHGDRRLVGIAAPAATPAPIIEHLSGVILAAITSEEAKPRFEALGTDMASRPAAFAAFVQESGVFWRQFLRGMGSASSSDTHARRSAPGGFAGA